MTVPRKTFIDLEKTPAELDKKREPQPTNAYLLNVPAVLHQGFIDRYLNLEKDYAMSARFSQSCFQLYSMYQPGLNRQLQQFLQAVVDDQIEIVKHILKACPALLLHTAKKKIVIESKHTWQKFNVKDENALTIAAKRRQLEMLETLLPYVNKSQDHKLAEETKADVLSKWPSYEHKEKKGEFDIPDAYIADLQAMIDVFKNETFPNGAGVEAKLSDKTEEALCEFRKKILPENAVTLDDSIQVELFLYAAYKVYEDNFCKLQDWDKRSAYCRYIIGFVQSLLLPKDAEKWCEGLFNIVEQKCAISSRAMLLQLFGGQDFYRSHRSSVSGLGGKYYCAGWGGVNDSPHSWGGGRIQGILEKLYQAKTAAVQNLCISQAIDHALRIV